MQRLHLIAAIAVLALPAAAVTGLTAGQQAAPAASADAAAPVVVELFTAQGCSSCPPADRFVSKLGGGGDQPGQVIALAYHVDYWNQLGWNDPFSAHKWTQRQASYGRALGFDTVYTPQVVVNGHGECSANKQNEVLSKISAAASTAPAGKVTLSAEAVTGGRKKQVHIKVGAHLDHPTHGLDLWVALTQSGLETSVKAGENKAATLHDDFVVRELKKAFSLPGKEGAERSGELTLDVDSDWGDTSKMAVVAFLQDPSTMAIQGAASQLLTAGR